MGSLLGFLLYFAAVAVVCLAALRRDANWALYGIACLMAGPLLTSLLETSGTSERNAALAAFVVPALALAALLWAKPALGPAGEQAQRDRP